MKKFLSRLWLQALLLLMLVSVSGTLLGQTYDVPVTTGDTVFIKKGGSILQTLPVSTTDSVYHFVLTKFAKAPVADTSSIVSIKSFSSKSGTAATTHTLASVSPGSLLVLATTFSGAGKTATITSSPSLAWVKQVDAQASNSGDAEIYTAVFTAGGSISIVANWGAGAQTSVAYVITGQETTLAGAKPSVTVQAIPSLNITTTKAGSLIIGAISDFNGRDGSGRAYRDVNSVEKFYNRAADKSGTAYHFIKQATTTGTYTEGLTTPGNQASGTVMIEIRNKGTVVFTPDATPPSASTLTLGSVTTTTVGLSWTTATDNVAVVAYDVYVNSILNKIVASGTSTTMSGLTPGTAYTMLVKARDAAGNVTGSNTVSPTTTTPPNQVPVADAGSDKSIILPVNSVTLNGSGTDADGHIVTYAWTKVSGPSTFTIGSASANTTAITNLVQGSYVFRLTVTDDSSATATDDVSVAVAAANSTDTTSIAYEGFGSQAVGGSLSSTVYHVTNLNSSGSGSLSAGIGSNKTIVFDVSGVIHGRFDLVGITYLTIDGTTSPSGISIDNQIAGDAISFDGPTTHHCILKGIEVFNAGMDGINVVDGSHDIMISQCTSYGNRDGNIDIAGSNDSPTSDSYNVTVQWCVFGNGAANDNSYSGDHLITGKFITSHHNLFVPATVGGVGERCPLIHANYSPVGSPNADVVSNLVWNFGRDNGAGSGFGSLVQFSGAANITYNYYHSLTGTDNTPNNAVVTNGSYGSTPPGSAYVFGNVSNGTNPNLTSNHAQYTIPDWAKVTLPVNSTVCSEMARVRQKAGTPHASVAQAAFKAGITSTLPGCP